MSVKSVFFISFFCLQGLWAFNENIDQYLSYFSSSNFGRIGDFTKGEMEIIARYDEILEVQKHYYNEFVLKGYSPVEAEKYSRVGVVEEDKYWIWFRDPLRLPNGKTTAYNRFFPKSGLNGAAGVVVMALAEDSAILVNVIFRNATREWELELPRGGREKNETSEEAALREFEEETGIRAKTAIRIGAVASDSGILSNILDIFIVNGLSVATMNREDCEAIHDCIFLSKKILKQTLADGFLLMQINGKKVKVFSRDPFLASALLISEVKGIL